MRAHQDTSASFTEIEDAAYDVILNYPWPGNIRELKNMVERVVLLEDDLGRVAEALRIGRHTMRIARQSLGVGLGLTWSP